MERRTTTHANSSTVTAGSRPTVG